MSAVLGDSSRSFVFFFFKQKTAYEITRCWSSDVCSSDLSLAKKFLGRIRVFRIGLIAARFANVRQRAAHGVHKFAGNFREKTRGQRSAQLLFVSENAAVHGASESERLSRPRHAHVNEAALFFNPFFFIDGAAVRANAFFHAGQKNMIELESLGAVESDESYAGLAFILIGVAHQRRGVEEIGGGFSGLHALSHGSRELFQIF